MGALTRVLTGGMAGGGKGDTSAKQNESPLNVIRSAFGRKKKSGGSSSDSGSDDTMESYHHGGKVRKTGAARLRKGEHVLTGRQYRKMKGRGRSRSKSR